MRLGVIVLWVGIILSIGWGADLQYDYLKEASLSEMGASILKNPAMINNETAQFSISRQDKLNALWQGNSLYVSLPSSQWNFGVFGHYDVISNIAKTSQI